MHRNTPGENIITSLLQVITGILMDDVITGDVNETHYSDVIMGMMVSQITNLAIVYSTIYSDADQRKHQSSVSLAFVWGIHRWPVNSLHKGPVTQKMFPFDDVIMACSEPDGQGVQNFCLELKSENFHAVTSSMLIIIFYIL